MYLNLFTRYVHVMFFNIDEEFGERSVFVSLDGIQSELILIDHPSGEMSVSKKNEKKKDLEKDIIILTSVLQLNNNVVASNNFRLRI